jgi:radical SAM-linked protein
LRIRIVFQKTEAMRFTGHLDLHKTWERTIRRARLPLAYSQGFHPQPRINLACALPLGFTSECELADLWLEAELPIQQAAAALEGALPPGIYICTVEKVDLLSPALQTQVRSAAYTLTLLDPITDLEERVQTLLSAEALPRVRRGKTYDLRPLIEALEPLPEPANGKPQLRVLLAAREGATGRPEEVAAALRIEPTAVRYHRVALILKNAAVN